MKPVISAFNAWSCTVVSFFAIIILSILGLLFNKNHHSLVGSDDSPEDGPAVAASIFTAVLIYTAFFVCCGFQAYLHVRSNRRGAISLQ